MSDRAWRELATGAQRSATAGLATMQEHRPLAAVLSCSDARVPPSVVFDQPAGELFIVRLAGNTASATAIASLGVELIVVLGHTHCGAVAAAANGLCAGALGPVVDPICRLAHDDPEATASELEIVNVARTVETLKRAGGAITAAHDEGRLHIEGALFDLDHSTLHAVPADGAELSPTPFPAPATEPSSITRPSKIPHEMETS